MYSLVIADDDEILLEGLATAFDWQMLGIRVVDAVTDGAAALDVLRREPCDILLTDIKMGRMDGLELTRLARDEFPRLRLLIMSAYEEFSFARHAVRVGVEDYIVKPIDLEQLRDTFCRVTEVLNREKAHQAYLTGINRRIDELGERSVEEYYRASGALNTSLIEHLARGTLLGSGQEIADDVERLGANLKDVSGGSFVFLVAALGTLAGRLNDSGQLSQGQKEALVALQQDAMKCQRMEDAMALLRVCLDGIAEELTERSMDVKGLIQTACRYVEARYAWSGLRLRDAAQHVGFSPSYFSAMFAKYAGESFSEYLLRIRMKEAQLLLSGTDLRTYEIAYKVGYDNPTYFSTLFKRFTGMTVSQYREAFGPKHKRFV